MTTTPFVPQAPDIDRLQLAQEVRALDTQTAMMQYSGFGMSKKIPWDTCADNAFTDIGNGLVLKISITDLSQEGNAFAAYKINLKICTFYPRFLGQVALSHPISLIRMQYVANSPSFTTVPAQALARTRVNMTTLLNQAWFINFVSQESGGSNIYPYTTANFSQKQVAGAFYIALQQNGNIHFRLAAPNTAVTVYPCICLGITVPTYQFSNMLGHLTTSIGGDVGALNDGVPVMQGKFTAPNAAALPERFKLLYPDSWFV